MKPDWKDAPEWANWLAMEEDGSWYWHENKPILGNVMWFVNGKYGEATLGLKWRESLEQRP